MHAWTEVRKFLVSLPTEGTDTKDVPFFTVKREIWQKEVSERVLRSENKKKKKKERDRMVAGRKDTKEEEKFVRSSKTNRIKDP